MPNINDNAKNAYPTIYTSYLNLQRMERTDQHKLIVYPKLNKLFLFDLEKDLEELRDLSKDLAYQSVKRELMDLLHQQQRDLSDPLGTFDFSKFQSVAN